MSAILKGYLLPLITAEITGVVGGNSGLTAVSAADIAAQRAKLINDLSMAITDAVSTAVQQYLAANVTVIPGQGVAVTTSGGPTNQAGGGATITPGILSAP